MGRFGSALTGILVAGFVSFVFEKCIQLAFLFLKNSNFDLNTTQDKTLFSHVINVIKQDLQVTSKEISEKLPPEGHVRCLHLDHAKTIKLVFGILSLAFIKKERKYKTNISLSSCLVGGSYVRTYVISYPNWKLNVLGLRRFLIDNS